LLGLQIEYSDVALTIANEEEISIASSTADYPIELLLSILNKLAQLRQVIHLQQLPLCILILTASDLAQCHTAFDSSLRLIHLLIQLNNLEQIRDICRILILTLLHFVTRLFFRLIITVIFKNV
jgi:hypothetical protein